MINIKKFIKDNSDFNYANFNRQFIKSQYEICGVRTPTLRKFAKDVEPEYIELEGTLTHEEILLYGFAASYIKSEDEQIEYLQNILPYIDNWCTCDCIVCSFKQFKTDKSYDFLTELLQDEKEFYIRVGIVGLMRFFIKTDKLDEILKNISKITNEAYYVKMAIAWLYAEIATFNFNKAKREIEKTQDKFIRNRAISKACESFRVDKTQKEELQKFRI